MNNNSDQASSQPGGLPLFVSGWGAGNINFNEPASFWEDVVRVTSDSILADHVDAAMTGRSSPRVWLFLHEPGESRLSVASALGFARELAHRDQAVLLLDGDDESADLTKWANRRDADGWIDLVRYGSSVLSSGDPMPFEGRRGYLLGVGSFTPADVTGPEIKELLTRLKRQADDILVVAPADSVGRLWALEADLRLLCWDRANRSASLVEGIVENYSAAGMPLTGMIGFGLPQATEEEADPVVDEVLVEESSKSASAILDDLEEDEEGFSPEDDEFARRKGNSGVFWIAVVVSLAMIGVASVYFLKNIRVPADGHFPGSSQQEVALGGAALFDSGTITLHDETVVDGSDAPIEQSNSLAGESLQQVADGELLDSATEDSPAVEAVVKQEEPEPEPEAVVPETPREIIPEPENTPVVDEFAMDPYLMTVGSGGWALHVFSFPDSLRAEQEKSLLAAKGFQSATRAVQIKEKGRWFRLYVGSFNTKAEANAARGKLLKELGEDWANPVRF